MTQRRTAAWLGVAFILMHSTSLSFAADSSKTCDLQGEKGKWLAKSDNAAFRDARTALERFKYDWDKIPWQSFAPEPAATAEDKSKADEEKARIYKRIIEVKEEYEGLLDGVIRRRLRACEVC